MKIRNFERTIILLITLPTILGIGTFANAQDEIPDQSKASILSTLREYNLVSLSEQPNWAGNQYGEIKLPKESIIHDDGIFRASNTDLVVYSPTPLVYSLYGNNEIKVLKPSIDFWSKQACLNKAQDVVKKAFPWFSKLENVPPVTILGPTSAGTYSFEWQTYREDELPDTKAKAQIRLLDGKVIDFGTSRFTGEWEHNISPSMAKQKAVEFATKNTSLTKFEVKNWKVGGGGGTRYYVVALSAIDKKTGLEKITSVSINAMTGVATNSNDGWSLRKGSVSNRLISDRWPTWTKYGLTFSSKRTLKDMPEWADYPEQAMLQSANGIKYLTSDFELAADTIGGGNSDVITIQRGEWDYALNTNNGDYYILGQPERRAITPIVSPDGKWSIVSAVSQTGATDIDLFSSKLISTSKMAIRRRLVIPKTDEHHAVFSSDGKWIYFISSYVEAEKIHHRLCRLNFTHVKAETEQRLGSNDYEVLASLPESVLRLTVFSDNSGLIIQGEKSVHSFSLTSRKLARLNLYGLKDPELNNSLLQDVEDACAGPGLDHITFSARTIDKSKTERRRIYSCRMNGIGVKPLTSIKDDPASEYHFPVGNKATFSVARDMALNEVGWKDNH